MGVNCCILLPIGVKSFAHWLWALGVHDFERSTARTHHLGRLRLVQPRQAERSAHRASHCGDSVCAADVHGHADAACQGVVLGRKSMLCGQGRALPVVAEALWGRGGRSFGQPGAKRMPACSSLHAGCCQPAHEAIQCVPSAAVCHTPCNGHPPADCECLTAQGSQSAWECVLYRVNNLNVVAFLTQYPFQLPSTMQPIGGR